MDLFPSSRGLKVTWSSVVKISQSLYREAPGKDPYRPDQATPVPNFFLAGSYTKQVSAASWNVPAPTGMCFSVAPGGVFSYTGAFIYGVISVLLCFSHLFVRVNT